MPLCYEEKTRIYLEKTQKIKTPNAHNVEKSQNQTSNVG